MALPVENNVRFQPLLLVLGIARLAGIIGGGLLLLVALLVLPFKLKSVYDYYFGFDRQEWLAVGKTLRAGKKGPSRNPRQSMVNDIRAHHLKSGMTRQQVLAILGPADVDGIKMRLADGTKFPMELTGEENDRNFAIWYKLHSQPDTIMQYAVGWGWIDPISLDVKLGGNGLVRSYEVIEH